GHGEQAAGTPLLQQRDAVDVGHPDVEQDEVGAQALAAGARLRCVFGELDAVAFVGEDFRQEGADAQFIVDNKNGGHGPLCTQCAGACAPGAAACGARAAGSAGANFENDSETWAPATAGSPP